LREHLQPEKGGLAITTEKKGGAKELSLLECAAEINNVSRVCWITGYGRQQFYEIRRDYKTVGAKNLDRSPGLKEQHPNRVSQEIEKAILDHRLKHSGHGCLRVAEEMALEGVPVSSSGVRGVWSRHNLLTRPVRLMRLEKAVSGEKVELSEEQVRLLERFGLSIAPHPDQGSGRTGGRGHLPEGRPHGGGPSLPPIGHRLPQPLCLWLALDLQSASDGSQNAQHRRPALLREPRGDGQIILSDNGREYRGRPDRHPYELFLQLEGIEHKTTRIGKGFVERIHRTLMDEHFRIKGRQKWAESVEEMQKDLDACLAFYSQQQPHQGRSLKGRPPSGFQGWTEGLET